MKKLMILGVALVLAATLAGCGGGSDAIVVSPAFVSVSGDAASDGYIEDNVVSLTAFQNDGIRVQSPLLLSFERAGFASFPIAPIPVASLVDSAQVKLFVTNIVPDIVGTSVSLDVYHVSYGSPLTPFNFITTPAIFVTTFALNDVVDINKDLPPFDFSPELQVDVDDPTHGFFQLMLIARNGVVVIEDSENSLLSGFRPQLDASYFP
jgi:hypothetical protein